MAPPPPSPGFPDHFSAVAETYARHRPTYPPELFTWLASLPEQRRRAWDCGTGSGQAAVALAAHFAEVVATDASAAQLAQAREHPRVAYRRAPAEAAGLPAGWADLVTVAQAVHWFEVERFWPEVDRVLAPRGVVAVWTYDLARVTPEVDAVIDRYYRDVVGPYWPPQRRLVESGYRDLPFPFDEVEAPPFAMRGEWDLERLAGYLRTWSSAKRWAEARAATAADPRAAAAGGDTDAEGAKPAGPPSGATSEPGVGAVAGETARRPLPDPVAEIRAELTAAWGDPEARRAVTWPLIVRAGRSRSRG